MLPKNNMSAQAISPTWLDTAKKQVVSSLLTSSYKKDVRNSTKISTGMGFAESRYNHTYLRSNKWRWEPTTYFGCSCRGSIGYSDWRWPAMRRCADMWAEFDQSRSLAHWRNVLACPVQIRFFCGKQVYAWGKGPPYWSIKLNILGMPDGGRRLSAAQRSVVTLRRVAGLIGYWHADGNEIPEILF